MLRLPRRFFVAALLLVLLPNAFGAVGSMFEIGEKKLHEIQQRGGSCFSSILRQLDGACELFIEENDTTAHLALALQFANCELSESGRAPVPCDFDTETPKACSARFEPYSVFSQYYVSVIELCYFVRAEAFQRRSDAAVRSLLDATEAASGAAAQMHDDLGDAARSIDALHQDVRASLGDAVEAIASNISAASALERTRHAELMSALDETHRAASDALENSGELLDGQAELRALQAAAAADAQRAAQELAGQIGDAQSAIATVREGAAVLLASIRDEQGRLGAELDRASQERAENAEEVRAAAAVQRDLLEQSVARARALLEHGAALERALGSLTDAHSDGLRQAQERLDEVRRTVSATTEAVSEHSERVQAAQEVLGGFADRILDSSGAMGHAVSRFASCVWHVCAFAVVLAVTSVPFLVAGRLCGCLAVLLSFLLESALCARPGRTSDVQSAIRGAWDRAARASEPPGDGVYGAPEPPACRAVRRTSVVAVLVAIAVPSFLAFRTRRQRQQQLDGVARDSREIRAKLDAMSAQLTKITNSPAIRFPAFAAPQTPPTFKAKPIKFTSRLGMDEDAEEAPRAKKRTHKRREFRRLE
eukprot:gnl/Chilomastix_cuspidata/2276.p1 GENE.gnl/Chilomastix_cuspidata/2276~~gnl/Chilomastix_cuspidata/2276.p1  ORF type:complete len:597 (+),score=278.31 gnl/Chilomastix_cuspidata/2276:1352-3142(+)